MQEAVKHLESLDEEEDDTQTVDIIELPPDKVDAISDEEEGSEEELDDMVVTDVPGTVEVVNSELEDDPIGMKPSGSQNKIKRRKLSDPPNWKTSQNMPTCIISDNYDNAFVTDEMINEHSDKTEMEMFSLLTENIRWL